MTGLKEMLLDEEKRLTNIIRKTEKQLMNVPEGTLRISTSNDCPQFYHKSYETSLNGKYINKSDKKLIAQLAQKSYDEKVLQLAQKRLKQIQKLENQYQNDEIEQLYKKQHPLRQALIQPVEPTWEQLFDEWKSETYEAGTFGENDPLILTENGMRVRSKSEKMMCDYMDRHNIPYKYEYPIHLKSVGIRRPDFTYFPQKLGYVVFHEHCGKMDDPDYANRFVKKIKDYQNNGIYVGERLFLTFESSKHVFNTLDFTKFLQKYVL